MKNNSLPKVAILILNWNNYQDTKRCLDSLGKLSYPNFSIVLVDNGSTDKSDIKLKKEFQHIHHIKNNKNLGFAGGNNVGIRYILENNFPYFLLLNNDTELIQPDFLTTLIKEIENEDLLGVIGPLVQRIDGSNQDTILPFPTLGVTIKSTLGLYNNDLSKKQYAESISGCCVLVRREVIKIAGLLDEYIFFYGEETEWFYRIRNAGWKIGYFPVKSIMHKGASSSTKIDDKMIYIERRSNVIYTLVKHNQIFRAVMMYGLMNLMLIYRILFKDRVSANRSEDNYPLNMIPEFYREVSRKWGYARNYVFE